MFKYDAISAFFERKSRPFCVRVQELRKLIGESDENVAVVNYKLCKVLLICLASVRDSSPTSFETTCQKTLTTADYFHNSKGGPFLKLKIVGSTPHIKGFY